MRDIVLALFIFGTIPFILSRPYIGLLVWSWLGYMNPNRLCYGFANNFPWVQIVAIATLVSLAFSKEQKAIRMSPIVVLLTLLFAWTTLATVFAVQTVSAWQTWQEFGKTLIMVVVTLMLVKDRQRMHWLIWLIVISVGFYGLRGGVFTILHGGAYHVYGPAKSFIADNNDLAQALCMILPLTRYLQLQANRKAVRVGLGFAMGIIIIGIFGTYSRGGLVALAIVGVALFLKSRRRLTIVVALVVLGVAAYHFMPQEWIARMDTLHHAEQTDSAQTRIQSWEFATNVALHRPLIGGGFNVYESSAMWRAYGPEGATPRAIHSIYFRILGEQGFPGLFLFIALLAASWRKCAKVRRTSRGLPEEKWAFDLASMLQVSLLAFIVAGLATTSSYFDLSYQLVAVCALLATIIEHGSAQTHEVGADPRVPRAHGNTANTVARRIGQ